jgi:hypothetical protein
VTEKSVGEIDKTIATSPIDKFANVVRGRKLDALSLELSTICEPTVGLAALSPVTVA